MNKPQGISSDEYLISINDPNTLYFDFTLFDIDVSEIVIENNEVYDLEDFKLISSLLRFVYYKNERIILEAGPIDVPKLAIKKLMLITDNSKKFLKIICNFVTYYSIFFTHYFCDFPLVKYSETKENMDKN